MIALAFLAGLLALSGVPGAWLVALGLGIAHAMPSTTRVTSCALCDGARFLLAFTLPWAIPLTLLAHL